MAIREKLAANAAHLLGPGETIQAAIPAQTVSQYFSLLSVWILILSNGYRAIIVTDRRILVCRSGRFRISPVKEVLMEVPRSTTIGPAHGLWYRTEALGMRLYINRRFQKDVAAADAEAQLVAT